MSQSWASPPLPEDAAAQATGSSRGLDGVAPEDSALVELALQEYVPPAKGTSEGSAEIEIEELGEADTRHADVIAEDQRNSADGSEPSSDVIETRPPAHISDDEFNGAPRVAGASIPPAEEQRSVHSLLTISTMIKIADVIGHHLSEETQAMDDAHIEALKVVLLDGKWPEDEDVARKIIVTIMVETHPIYAKRRASWPDMPFKELRKLFLEEMRKSKLPPLKRLATVLTQSPPPMPKSVRPNKP